MTRFEHSALLVHHKCRISRQWFPDGHGLVGIAFGPRGNDRRFGRPIRVEHPPSGSAPARDQIARTGFAADDQNANRRQIPFHHGQQGRHARQHGDARVGQQARQIRSGMHHVGRCRKQRGPRAPGQPQFLNRRIERDRKTLVNQVVFVNQKPCGLGLDQVNHIPMFQLHSLGFARRTRGVNHIAQILGPLLFAGETRSRDRLRRDLRPVHDDLDHPSLEPRQLLDILIGRDDDLRRAILQDVRHAIGGIFGVQRHIGSARLENSQQRDVNVSRPRQPEPNTRFRPHAHRAQMVRQLVGGVIQFPIRQGNCPTDDGHLIGRLVRLRLKQFMQKSRYNLRLLILFGRRLFRIHLRRTPASIGVGLLGGDWQWKHC